MEKYICDTCGYELEALAEIHNCPICKGNLIREVDMKEREEIARQIAEDRPDDDLTPKQDADEAVEQFLTLAMEKNIGELGNDRTYHIIENFILPKQRYAYRHYFLLAGGQVPENNLLGQLNEGGNITYTI